MKRIFMKWIFRTLAAVVLMMTAVMPTVAGADTGAQDLDTYVEVDAPGTISVINDGGTLAFSSDKTGTQTYLYYDFGEAYFDDNSAVIEFEWNISNTWGELSLYNYMTFPVFLCSREAQTTYYQANTWGARMNGAEYKHDGYSPGFGTIRLYNRSAGSIETYSDPITVNDNTRYYMRYRVDNAVSKSYLEIYTDAEHSEQVGETLELSCVAYEGKELRYLYLKKDWWQAYNRWGSGDISNVSITIGGVPKIETLENPDITYQPSAYRYRVNLCANLTNDGGGATVGFYLTSDNITWEYVGALDDDAGIYTGYKFLSSYYVGNNYWYYAYAMNTYGSDTGDVEIFTLERTDFTPPVVDTVGVTDISANGTTLWGTVYDDGGANTTGRFQYKVVGADNWTDTDNVTGLASNHGFSAVLPAVPEGVYMMFRAVAENEHGIDYGEIEYFIWQDVGAMPTVTTGAAIDVDYDSATLTGGIEDDGGGYCVVGFDFKRDDETEWTRFEIGGEYSTGDNFTYTLPGGLAELTTYHFRALAANAAGYNEIGDYYTYALGDIVQFTTTQRTGMPVVTLLSVAWHDNYTARATFRIDDDGGVVCHGNLRYRIPYGAWQYDDSVPNIEGLSTGDTATTYVRGLTYGAEYEFQAWVFNDMSGGFGYSNILRYQLVAGDDTTTPPAGDAAAGISNQLTTWGLNNTGGRLLVVVGSMVLVFLLVVLLPGRRYQEYVRYTVPVAGCIDAVLLIFWMSVGYVPVLLTAGILVAAAGTIAMFVVRMFRGRGAPAGD